MGTDAIAVSPFGGEVRLVARYHLEELRRRYKEKCGADVSIDTKQSNFAELYECELTGYKFWYPFELAGDERFYKLLAACWPNYYREERWEYGPARRLINPGDKCLEIGCGMGYFLQSIEAVTENAEGLELNHEAISNAVCKSPIMSSSIQDREKISRGHYDVVFSFQVLEHISNPFTFLKSCVACLKEDGLLVISVPNDEYVVHADMQDVFNFPPHHMGSYTEKSLEEIGKLIGMEPVSIQCAPPEWPGIRVTRSVSESTAWRVFNRVVKLLGRFLLQRAGEPGHTMLVVYRRAQ